jgi:hypothetical protein
LECPEDGSGQLLPKRRNLLTSTESYHRSYYLRLNIFIYDIELNVLCGIELEKALRVYSGLKTCNWKLHAMGSHGILRGCVMERQWQWPRGVRRVSTTTLLLGFRV